MNTSVSARAAARMSVFLFGCVAKIGFPPPSVLSPTFGNNWLSVFVFMSICWPSAWINMLFPSALAIILAKSVVPSVRDSKNFCVAIGSPVTISCWPCSVLEFETIDSMLTEASAGAGIVVWRTLGSIVGTSLATGRERDGAAARGISIFDVPEIKSNFCFLFSAFETIGQYEEG